MMDERVCWHVAAEVPPPWVLAPPRFIPPGPWHDRGCPLFRPARAHVERSGSEAPGLLRRTRVERLP